MIFVRKYAFATLAIALIAGGAMACATCTEFKDARAIFSTPTLGVAYVSFVSEKNDTLTGLTSDCCAAVELHTSSSENGVMKMRKLDSLNVKSGVPVELTGREGGEATSMHVMLIGVKKPYKAGQKLRIMFNFVKSGNHEVNFTVAKRGEKPAADAHSMPMDHGGHHDTH